MAEIKKAKMTTGLKPIITSTNVTGARTAVSSVPGAIPIKVYNTAANTAAIIISIINMISMVYCSSSSMYSNVRFGLNSTLQITNPITAPISPKISGLDASFGAIKYPPSVVTLLMIKLKIKSRILTTSSQTSMSLLVVSFDGFSVIQTTSCIRMKHVYLNINKQKYHCSEYHIKPFHSTVINVYFMPLRSK